MSEFRVIQKSQLENEVMKLNEQSYTVEKVHQTKEDESVMVLSIRKFKKIYEDTKPECQNKKDLKNRNKSIQKRDGKNGKSVHFQDYQKCLS